MPNLESLILLLLAYLLGSIPFGLLLTRAAGLDDIRTIGSGNIGATNVLRTGNKKLAALTLLLDGLKGWVAVYLGYRLFPSVIRLDPTTHYVLHLFPVSIYVLPVMPVIGHIFPLWLKGKGGKGVATAFGATLALFPAAGGAGLMLWLLVFFYSRTSSLSALAAISAIPFFAWFGHGFTEFLQLLMIALLVTYRHKDNIRRLRAGTEPKFGTKA